MQKCLYWWNEIEGFNVRKYSQGKMATAANPKIKAGLQIVRQLVQFLWHNLTKKIIPPSFRRGEQAWEGQPDYGPGAHCQWSQIGWGLKSWFLKWQVRDHWLVSQKKQKLKDCPFLFICTYQILRWNFLSRCVHCAKETRGEGWQSFGNLQLLICQFPRNIFPLSASKMRDAPVQPNQSNDVN